MLHGLSARSPIGQCAATDLSIKFCDAKPRPAIPATPVLLGGLSPSRLGAVVISSLKIYEELSETMDPTAARKLASILDSLYQDVKQTVTRADFEELKGVVRELAEAQKRTESRVAELAEAQKRTEQRLDSLAARVEELAEAQKRTESRVAELAEAQKRTESRVAELAEAQKRTEESVRALADRLNDTNKQLGGLSMTVGYQLEDRAYRFLPRLLRRDFEIELEEPLRRDYLADRRGRDIEVNILGLARRAGRPVLIVGESKAQLSRREVDQFLGKRVAVLESGGRELFPVIVAYMGTERGVAEYGREKGVAIYYTYQFEQESM
jgi:predicted transcriptional regulator